MNAECQAKYVQWVKAQQRMLNKYTDDAITLTRVAFAAGWVAAMMVIRERTRAATQAHIHAQKAARDITPPKKGYTH
jgi:hypothetical protein